MCCNVELILMAQSLLPLLEIQLLSRAVKKTRIHLYRQLAKFWQAVEGDEQRAGY